MKTKRMHSWTRKKGDVEKKIEGTAWALFFLWVGLTLLLDLSYGIGLLGVGIITLGGQVVRNFYHLHLEGFWLVVGTGFFVGGLWEILDPDIALVPILLIIAGFALLYSIWLKGRLRNEENA